MLGSNAAAQTSGDKVSNERVSGEKVVYWKPSELDTLETRTFSIYYRLNKIAIDEHYLDNEDNLAYIKNSLATSPRIDSITVYSYASPEGDRDHNRWLAEKRGEAAKKYIIDHLPDGSALLPEHIYLRPGGENWEGLIALAEAQYKLMNREEVLRILHSKRNTESKKKALIALDKGYTYHYLVTNLMPTLRYATWICVWEEKKPREVLALEPVEPIAPPQLMAAGIPLAVQKEPAKYRKTVIAVRTNLLNFAANFGFEIPIGDHWSIGTDYYFPWWLGAHNKYCFQFTQWQFDAKYWFTGEKYKWTEDSKLKGHAVGFYAGAGYYDFQKRMKLGYQGEFINLGFDYTYALPIAHDKLRLEFNVGLGYVYTTARHYTPTPDYDYLIRDPKVRHENHHYFGPTRACVSLVWPWTFTYRRK